MTFPIPDSAMERARVEQVDREAAADWFVGHAGPTLEAECMREGTADHWRLVQAFARHRAQAHAAGLAEGVARGREEAAKVVDEDAAAYRSERSLSAEYCTIALEDSAAAIRALGKEPTA